MTKSSSNRHIAATLRPCLRRRHRRWRVGVASALLMDSQTTSEPATAAPTAPRRASDVAAARARAAADLPLPNSSQDLEDEVEDCVATVGRRGGRLRPGRHVVVSDFVGPPRARCWRPQRQRDRIVRFSTPQRRRNVVVGARRLRRPSAGISSGRSGAGNRRTTDANASPSAAGAGRAPRCISSRSSVNARSRAPPP